MLIPIGTDVRTRKRPVANWALIGLNVLMYLFTDIIGGQVGEALKPDYMLDAARPLLYQYLTYQFLHGDLMHLLGNMIFLWIFGGPVCDRMGAVCYVLFYLAGGVTAGFVFALFAENPMLGASGSIAAVTTAFLVLFPRVHVTLLLFFILITTFQLPAMIIILFKIILWDNIIAPYFDQDSFRSNVAFSAHLGGYAFGFLVALVMLTVRALPRNQFDMLALWSRWRRRSLPGGSGPLTGPHSARAVVVDELDSRPLSAEEASPAERLRLEILERLTQRDLEGAARLYVRLGEVDDGMVLPRQQQLEVGNALAQSQRHREAVRAYEQFLSAYPTAPDIFQVRLLVGLICHRYLGRFAEAVEHLQTALGGLTLDSQRALAADELRQAEMKLPASPDGDA